MIPGVAKGASFSLTMDINMLLTLRLWNLAEGVCIVEVGQKCWVEIHLAHSLTGTPVQRYWMGVEAKLNYKKKAIPKLFIFWICFAGLRFFLIRAKAPMPGHEKQLWMLIGLLSNLQIDNEGWFITPDKSGQLAQIKINTSGIGTLSWFISGPNCKDPYSRGGLFVTAWLDTPMS